MHDGQTDPNQYAPTVSTAFSIELSEVKAERDRLREEPQLGLATIRQLLDELSVRFEIHCDGGLDYKTVGGEGIANASPQVGTATTKRTP